jgi:hypothetical protein
MAPQKLAEAPEGGDASPGVAEGISMMKSIKID